MKSYMAEMKRFILSLTNPDTFYQSIRDKLLELQWCYEDRHINELQRIADRRYKEIGGE